MHQNLVFYVQVLKKFLGVIGVCQNPATEDDFHVAWRALPTALSTVVITGLLITYATVHCSFGVADKLGLL